MRPEIRQPSPALVAVVSSLWELDPASGSVIANTIFRSPEPDAGSNSHKLDTVATRDGDGWRLSGRKYYISGVDEADAVLVVSRTGVEEGSGRGRLSLFIVDTDAPGLERAPIELHVNAPERQFFLFLDEVRGRRRPVAR